MLQGKKVVRGRKYRIKSMRKSMQTAAVTFGRAESLCSGHKIISFYQCMQGERPRAREMGRRKRKRREEEAAAVSKTHRKPGTLA